MKNNLKDANPQIEQMRLQRFLARSGVASRRKCEEIIAEGRVSVNGEVISEPGCKVIPSQDIIFLDGIKVELPKDTFTIMLNKPCGYVTTVKDTHGRKTVMDLVPAQEHPGLFPVGRLDAQTSGLLLFTTDGDLAQSLLHPSMHADKTYLAVVEGVLNRAECRRLEQGIKLDDGMTAPAKCRIIESKNNRSTVELTIHEGRKRQVRRMFAALRHPVVSLNRQTFGGLELGELKQGCWRELSESELALLRGL
jgi:23S rRNA pseudouridine2605 synthase